MGDCALCMQAKPHPQFAVLVCDKRRWRKKSFKDASVWDYGRVPLVKLGQHNCEFRMQRGPKSTRSSAPHNHNVLIISGFVRGAGVFVAVMRAYCRTFTNHLVRGARLAKLWNLIDPAQKGKPLTITLDEPYHDRILALLAFDKPASPTLVRQMTVLCDAARVALT